MAEKSKIGLDGLKEVDSVNVGDVIFIRAASIDSWGISKDEPPFIDKVYYNINSHSDYFFETTISTGIVNSDMLLAVKYLGNGIFEEMKTGEKIMGTGTYADYNLYADYDRYDLCFNIAFDDYKESAKPGEEEYYYERYIKCCEEYKNIEKNLSILNFTDLDIDYNGKPYLIEVNDASKREYLKYSDEERINVINRFKDIAKKAYQDGLEAIQAELDKLKSKNALTDPAPLNDETIDMANLENELYDFQQGKSK